MPDSASIITVNDFQGLNLSDPPDNIGDRQLSEALNVEIGYAGEIRKRPGWLRKRDLPHSYEGYGSLDIVTNPTFSLVGVFRSPTLGGQTERVVAFIEGDPSKSVGSGGNSGYYISTGLDDGDISNPLQEWVAVPDNAPAGIADDSRPRAAVQRFNYLYVANSAGGVVVINLLNGQVEDYYLLKNAPPFGGGSAVVDVRGGLNYNGQVVFHGVFLPSGTGAGAVNCLIYNTVATSNPITSSEWNFQEVGDVTTITGIHVVQDLIIVLKQSGIWTVRTTDQFVTASIRQTRSGTSCDIIPEYTDLQPSVELDGLVYYITRAGKIYRTNGTTVEDIGRPVDRIIESFPLFSGLRFVSVFAFENRVYFYVPTTQLAPGWNITEGFGPPGNEQALPPRGYYIFVWHVDKNLWTRWTAPKPEPAIYGFTIRAGGAEGSLSDTFYRTGIITVSKDHFIGNLEGAAPDVINENIFLNPPAALGQVLFLDRFDARDFFDFDINPPHDPISHVKLGIEYADDGIAVTSTVETKNYTFGRGSGFDRVKWVGVNGKGHIVNRFAFRRTEDEELVLKEYPGDPVSNSTRLSGPGMVRNCSLRVENSSDEYFEITSIDWYVHRKRNVSKQVTL